MNRITLCSVILGISIFSGVASAQSQPVQYMQDCSAVYGVGYYYLPGTEPSAVEPLGSSVCMNVFTGETKQEIDGKTISGQTQLADRILALEKQIFGLQDKEKNLPVNVDSNQDEIVVYVGICALTGHPDLSKPGYMMVPGTDPNHYPGAELICINESTGGTRQLIGDEIISGQNELADRVLALETALDLFYFPLALASTMNHVVEQYVRTCTTPSEIYGIGYYFLPNLNVCLNAETGETKVATSSEVITGQSELANRVLALETQWMALQP